MQHSLLSLSSSLLVLLPSSSATNFPSLGCACWPDSTSYHPEAQTPPVARNRWHAPTAPGRQARCQSGFGEHADDSHQRGVVVKDDVEVVLGGATGVELQALGVGGGVLAALMVGRPRRHILEMRHHLVLQGQRYVDQQVELVQNRLSRHEQTRLAGLGVGGDYVASQVAPLTANAAAAPVLALAVVIESRSCHWSGYEQKQQQRRVGNEQIGKGESLYGKHEQNTPITTHKTSP